MKKNYLKIMAAVLSALLVSATMGCNVNNNNTESSSESIGESDEINKDYTPFDESLRVDDTRKLSAADYSVMNIVGTDDFGRTILSVDGKKSTDRYVGMFYFLTLGQHTNHTGIYDIDSITEQGTNPEAFTTVNNNTTPVGSAHFWGEPVWGYYNSKDPWVMRKQIEMLTMAGVDFIVLDTSNNVLYKQVTDVLFPIMQEYYDKGWNVPKVVYYLGKHSLESDTKALEMVYNDYYKPDKYKDLWFCPDNANKPMIIAPDNVIADFAVSTDSTKLSIYNLFDFRVTQWPINSPVNDTQYDLGAPWIDFQLPQTPEDGWISVSIAQHVTVNMTDTVNSRGRGWTPSKKIAGIWYGVNDHDNWRKGPNYQAQWDTVLNMTDEQKENYAKFTFITGWNEWVAEKIKRSDGDYFTCDTYNAEYSRDIEPSRSSNMKDNFYLQTIQNIHKDNYNEAKHYKYGTKTPDIEKDDTDTWNRVSALYKDFTGECTARDFAPMAGLENYVDNSNRNDIDTISVAHDENYLYFRVTCADNISTYNAGDTSWMNIWLKTANGSGDTLNGYNYVINRSVNGSTSEIMRCKSKNDIKSVGQGDVRVYGKTMIVRVKLSDLNLSAKDYNIDFKVTDNITNIEKDILNMYCTGDAAPIGRLNFKYGY